MKTEQYHKICLTLSNEVFRIESSSLNFISLVFGVSGKSLESIESISEKLISLVDEFESETISSSISYK